jgi:hypothetical protein
MVVPKRLITEVDHFPGRNKHKLFSEEGLPRLLSLPRKTAVPKDFVLPSFKDEIQDEELNVKPKSRNFLSNPSKLT